MANESRLDGRRAPNGYRPKWRRSGCTEKTCGTNPSTKSVRSDHSSNFLRAADDIADEADRRQASFGGLGHQTNSMRGKFLETATKPAERQAGLPKTGDANPACSLSLALGVCPCAIPC